MPFKICLAIVLSLILSLAACDDDKLTLPIADRPVWSFEPDSMNIGILLIDYLTGDLLGGRVDHFAPCDSCDRDSLPVTVLYVPPMDIGSSTFIYTGTQDTLLYIQTNWSAPPEIRYPQFLPPTAFQELPWRFAPPLKVEYFGGAGRTDPINNADIAWSHIESLDVVGEFAKSAYRVGISLLPGYERETYGDYRWLILLSRGGRPSNNRIQLTSASVTRAAGHPACRPAGYGGRGRS